MNDIQQQVQHAIAIEQKTINRQMALKTILGLMDLTTLEGNDHDEKIRQLCLKAVSLKDTGIGVDSTAAVCVYPVFVKLAKSFLKGSNVRVAAVAGGFPSGQMALHLRVQEVEWTVAQGADEVDMVISRGKMLCGDSAFVAKEVREHKKACGKAHLKVILETGELAKPEIIENASIIAIDNGADFIKTSTGKIQPAATTEAAWIMLHQIKKHFQKTGIKIGFKPAGGIATPQDAIEYYLLVKHILGESWLVPDLFRYGASRLFDSVVNELTEAD